MNTALCPQILSQKLLAWMDWTNVHFRANLGQNTKWLIFSIDFTPVFCELKPPAARRFYQRKDHFSYQAPPNPTGLSSTSSYSFHYSLLQFRNSFLPATRWKGNFKGLSEIFSSHFSLFWGGQWTMSNEVLRENISTANSAIYVKCNNMNWWKVCCQDSRIFRFPVAISFWVLNFSAALLPF